MSALEQIKAGDVLPEREFKTGNVQLFLYNAVLWNAHRIHFDLPYATEVEGYPGLVNAGPLMGDWLTQCVNEWLDAHPQYEVKLVNLTVGILTAKLKEPHLICQVWV